MAMKRRLEFSHDDRSQKRFEILYCAVLMGGVTPTQQRVAGIEMIRRESRILNALDGVSLEDPDVKSPTWPTEVRPRVVAPGTSVELVQADWELLRKRVQEALWLPKAARDVMDVDDWLGAATEVQDMVQA